VLPSSSWVAHVTRRQVHARMLAKTLPPLRVAAEASEEPARFEITDLALFIGITSASATLAAADAPPSPPPPPPPLGPPPGPLGPPPPSTPGSLPTPQRATWRTRSGPSCSVSATRLAKLPCLQRLAAAGFAASLRFGAMSTRSHPDAASARPSAVRRCLRKLFWGCDLRNPLPRQLEYKSPRKVVIPLFLVSIPLLILEGWQLECALRPIPVCGKCGTLPSGPGGGYMGCFFTAVGR